MLDKMKKAAAGITAAKESAAAFIVNRRHALVGAGAFIATEASTSTYVDVPLAIAALTGALTLALRRDISSAIGAGLIVLYGAGAASLAVKNHVDPAEIPDLVKTQIEKVCLKPGLSFAVISPVGKEYDAKVRAVQTDSSIITYDTGKSRTDKKRTATIDVTYSYKDTAWGTKTTITEQLQTSYTDPSVPGMQKSCNPLPVQVPR